MAPQGFGHACDPKEVRWKGGVRGAGAQQATTEAKLRRGLRELGGL